MSAESYQKMSYDDAVRTVAKLMRNNDRQEAVGILYLRYPNSGNHANSRQVMWSHARKMALEASSSEPEAAEQLKQIKEYNDDGKAFCALNLHKQLALQKEAVLARQVDRMHEPYSDPELNRMIAEVELRPRWFQGGMRMDDGTLHQSISYRNERREQSAVHAARDLSKAECDRLMALLPQWLVSDDPLKVVLGLLLVCGRRTDQVIRECRFTAEAMDVDKTGSWVVCSTKAKQVLTSTKRIPLVNLKAGEFMEIVDKVRDKLLVHRIKDSRSVNLRFAGPLGALLRSEGFPELTPHDLRKAYVRVAWRQHGDHATDTPLAFCNRVLDHKSLETSLHYAGWGFGSDM